MDSELILAPGAWNVVIFRVHSFSVSATVLYVLPIIAISMLTMSRAPRMMKPKNMEGMHIVCEDQLDQSFDELSGKGAFEMRHSSLYFFSLVRISEFVHTNFSSTCGWCMHLHKG